LIAVEKVHGRPVPSFQTIDPYMLRPVHLLQNEWALYHVLDGVLPPNVLTGRLFQPCGNSLHRWGHVITERVFEPDRVLAPLARLQRADDVLEVGGLGRAGPSRKDNRCNSAY